VALETEGFRAPELDEGASTTKVGSRENDIFKFSLLASVFLVDDWFTKYGTRLSAEVCASAIAESFEIQACDFNSENYVSLSRLLTDGLDRDPSRRPQIGAFLRVLEGIERKEWAIG
jgi:hypothetical protein